MFKSSISNACEAIDRAVTIDVASYGIVTKLYNAARKHSRDPLSYSAGRAIFEASKSGRNVILITGFPVPSPFSSSQSKPAVHSDGPVGIVCLLKALVRKASVDVTVLTDKGLGDLTRSCIESCIGREASQTVSIEELPLDSPLTDRFSDIISSVKPGVIVASEKSGRNKVGEYHVASGKNLTPYVARFDSIFEIARRQDIQTVAAGDLGNDLGMGNIAEDLAMLFPSETMCQCPCRSGIISSVECDKLMIGSMCDWGVYGMLTYLAIEYKDLTLIPTAELVRSIMVTLSKSAGLADPRQLITDGIPYDYTTSCLELLRGIASSQL